MKYSLTILIICLTIFTASVTSQADTGIIVALNSTVQEFKKTAGLRAITTKSGRDFFAGNLEGEQIILVRSPMGKVNNAITAQTLITSFAVDVIYSISPAGAIGDKFEIGDVVIATNALQHDFGTIKPYGFIWSELPNNLDTAMQREEGFPLDENLIKPVMTAWEKMSTRHKMHIGTLVSGDQFIASHEKNKWLEKKFNASAVDMGGAAIAQTCQANNVSCCLLRVITDKAEIEARGDFNTSAKGCQTDINLTAVLKNVFAQNRAAGGQQ